MMMRHLSRLGVALVLTLGVLSAPAFAGDVSAALKYVPADFSTVVVVDVAALQKSSLAAMVDQMLSGNPGAKEMEKAVGFDPKTDLSTLVFAGPDAFMSHDEQFVAILDIKIDAKKLVEFVKQQAKDETITEKKVGSAVLYQVDKESAFAIDGGFVVAGYAPLVEKALAAKGGKSVATGPLKDVIKRFKGSKGAFAVMRPGKKVREVLGGDMPDFAKLVTAGFGLDAADGAGISIVGNFESASAASAVADGMQQMLKDAASDPEVKEMGLGIVMSKIAIKADGKAVEISVKMADDEVKKLLGTLLGGH